MLWKRRQVDGSSNFREMAKNVKEWVLLATVKKWDGLWWISSLFTLMIPKLCIWRSVHKKWCGGKSSEKTAKQWRVPERVAPPMRVHPEMKYNGFQCGINRANKQCLLSLCQSASYVPPFLPAPADLWTRRSKWRWRFNHISMTLTE